MKLSAGFLVYGGIKIGDIVPSFATGTVYKLRKRIEGEDRIASGVLVVGYTFTSPSAAAAVILGGSANGW